MFEIRFAGFGGQGIIRSGIIVGRAASIYDHKNSTMNQSFGPEARGGACSSQLLVSDTKILYPYILKSDILVGMSQAAYEKFEPELKETGMLLYDSDLVKLKEKRGQIKICPIPATRFAEELGARIAGNVVMLGFFTALTDVVSVEAMKKAVPESVPGRFIELNLNAFNKGYEHGIKLIEKDS
ncbi:MAG: 2-oxoacid:acceptor oxidoreductase family protein [bacterium]|jgi:2-oxoglutarate ferredoxin oxidoreductase subunit gamma|nr:2-oxoacid:acceptor oxidoreductase family protein [bacterium]